MKQIRKGIFETNSSSTHSVTIEGCVDEDICYEIAVDECFTFLVSGETDFGWQVEDYFDIDSKINYLYIYARDWAGKDSELYMEKLVYVLRSQLGIRYFTNLWKTDEGYIDHQSVENRDLDYIFEDVDVMRDFLFSSRSYIHTDNDNY